MVNNKVLKFCEDRCKDKINNEIIEYCEKGESNISLIEELYQEILLDISSNIEYYKKNISLSWSKVNELDKNIDSILENSLMLKEGYVNTLQIILEKHFREILSLASNQKDFNIIKCRNYNFQRNMIAYIESFLSDIDERVEDLIVVKKGEVFQYIKTNIDMSFEKIVNDINTEYYNLYINSLLKEDEIKNNIDRNIFSFKEMIKLAESKGYQYKYSSGSHNIYEHNQSKKIVVIPNHELGKGISNKIIKQIETNAI